MLFTLNSKYGVEKSIIDKPIWLVTTYHVPDINHLQGIDDIPVENLSFIQQASFFITAPFLPGTVDFNKPVVAQKIYLSLAHTIERG